MNRKSSAKEKVAILYDENNFMEVYTKAEELRNSYDVSIFKKPKKLKGFLDRLQNSGFIGFAYSDGNIRTFEK